MSEDKKKEEKKASETASEKEEKSVAEKSVDKCVAKHGRCYCVSCKSMWRWITAVFLVVVVIGFFYVKKNNITNVNEIIDGGLKKVQTVEVDDPRQFSYAVGYVLGKQLEQTLPQIPGNETIRKDDLIDAIADVLSGGKTAMTEQQVQELLTARAEAERKKFEELSEQNKAAGERFREEYAKQEGVKKTQSGVLYKVITEGDGPVVGDKTANVHYRGKLINGEEFDSSYSYGEEPVLFSAKGLIPGFAEVLRIMRVGDKWEIVIPEDQAYGPAGAGEKIGPNETLIFEVEITGLVE